MQSVTTTPESHDAVVRKFVSGVMFKLLGGGGQTVVRLAGSVVLARLLEPRDFGLFGIAMLAYKLIDRLASAGVGSGVIAKKDLTAIDLDTCYLTIVFVRLTAFFVILVLAKPISLFFNEMEVAYIIQFVSIIFIISLIGAVNRQLLQKNLAFRGIVFVDFLSTVLSVSVSIGLAAMLSLSYWALVFGLIVSELFKQVGFFIIGGWRPSFKWSGESFRYFFKFGWTGIGYALANYFNQNIDYFVVGRVLGAAKLGLYEYAFKLPEMVQKRFSRPLGSVLFPALSASKKSNNNMLNLYMNSVYSVVVFVFPVLGLLIVLAEPIVLTLWGAKWIGVVQPMRILCLAAAVRSITTHTGYIYLSKDRPEYRFVFGWIRFVVTVISVYLLGVKFGLVGVAWGMFISTIPSIVYTHFALKMMSFSIWGLSKKLAPVWAMCLCVVMLSYFAVSYLRGLVHDFVLCVVVVLASLIIYIGMIFLFQRKEFMSFVKIAKSFI